MTTSTKITLTNQLDELERLRLLVSEFGGTHGFKAEDKTAVHLCLEEMATNIISYAWPKEESHEFEIRLSVDETTIKAEFEDDGVAFDPTHASDADTTSDVAQRPIGGLGIHLVKSTMNTLYYQRVEERNVLIAKKQRS
ncbi:ATP-binding protein [Verrucomicrobia bacterium]|nr:ATP-binding protein [Verrucomicrobiota bacterium]